MLAASPQCSHITRKRGIYHCRRRLPGRARGEVSLSLRTRRYREAGHRAALVDVAFREAWGRALSEAEAKGTDLGPILRDYLREALERDIGASPSPSGAYPLSLWPLGMLQAALEDKGHIALAQHEEWFKGFRFEAGRAAREQRDAWSSGDLARLFGSPVWTGCHPRYRSKPGKEIIRDAKFWLPILALYTGARLEELADLRRGDIGCDEGTWASPSRTQSDGSRTRTQSASSHSIRS